MTFDNPCIDPLAIDDDYEKINIHNIRGHRHWKAVIQRTVAIQFTSRFTLLCEQNKRIEITQKEIKVDTHENQRQRQRQRKGKEENKPS